MSQSGCHRERLLAELNEAIQAWARGEYNKTLIQKGVSSDERKALVDEKTVVQLRTYGSYRLGVDDPHSDVDVLCVAPKWMPRELFFHPQLGFDQTLVKWIPRVEKLNVIREANVPLMTFVLDGVEFDIVFASVPLDELPHEEDFSIVDNSILIGMDQKTLKAINGARVTDMILKLVPDVDVFRHALRTIKQWARKRGICSNIVGYIGGVSWAIMVAKICQLRPQ